MKKKFMVYGLWFMVFLLYTIYYIPYTIQAADSTPSASVQSKLDELKKEIASKAAQLKQEISSKLQNKAYLGPVKIKSADSLTLATHSGPKIIRITQDTNFESQIKKIKTPTLKNINQDDFIVALGDLDDTGVLVAKKIILMGQPKLVDKNHFWGQVVIVSDNLLTVKDKEGSSQAVVNKSTAFPKVNDFVIISGKRSKNDILEASFIYLIPQGGFIKPKKSATPSAQLATPSATPKTSTPSGKKK